MDDGVISIVEVSQTNSHILKDGVVNLLRHDAIAVQALGESGGQELHHQNWGIGGRLPRRSLYQIPVLFHEQ